MVRSNSHGTFHVIRAKKMEPIIGIDEEGASLTKSLNVYSEARSDAEDKVKATDHKVRIAIDGTAISKSGRTNGK